MELLYKIKDRVQQDSISYIEDNKASVTENNQKTLCTLNIICFIVVFGYFCASLNVFSEWQVTRVYAGAVILHAVILPIVLIRYKKKTRSYKEVSIACSMFQLYVMTFTGIMSIIPVEMNQPAVYYMPMTVAFMVAFTYTFYQAMGLMLVEMAVYMLASFLTKSIAVFSVDLFSCIFGIVLAGYVAKILYSYRAREHEAKQRLRRMGMVDRLTSTYNKASTEFLCNEFMRSHPTSDCVMVIVDFDNFKTVNDTYGHQAGDVCLKQVADRLKMLEKHDGITAFRYGGDEFVVLYMNLGEVRVREIAEELRRQIRELKVEHSYSQISDIVSISQGICWGYPVKDQRMEDYLHAADDALYQVKKSERGKICLTVYSDIV